MDAELERTIIHYYPQRALVSPLGNEQIIWDYDPGYTTLKAILAELKQIDPEVRPGTRGRYDIGEEIVLIDSLRLQVSYLGPFAAWNHGIERELDEDEREVQRRATKVLEKHGVRVLDEATLDEVVPWIQHGTPKGTSAKVWDCLFVIPE